MTCLKLKLLLACCLLFSIIINHIGKIDDYKSYFNNFILCLFDFNLFNSTSISKNVDRNLEKQKQLKSKLNYN